MKRETLRIGSYAFVPREKIGSDEWNKFADIHVDGCWWHRWEWLEYCLAYAGGTDHSMGIMLHDQLCGILPLIEESGQFKGGRNPLACALATFQDDELAMCLTAYVHKVAQWAKVLTGEFMVHPHASVPANQWESLNTENISFKTRVIDLTKPVADRKHDVRDSYKSLLNKYDCIGGADIVFPAYEQLHQGKYNMPRSQATYDLQKSWCASGFARVYAVPSEQSKSQLADAAALWFIYKQHAYYASAVNTGKNLAHPLMWFALNDLARMGVQTAELGWQGLAKTEKEKNIEFWKRGWGGSDWTIVALRQYYGVQKHGGSA